MKKLLFITLALCFPAGIVYAQPRPVDRTPMVTNTPDSYAARYEGGIFGASGKQKGTLKFDDANLRLIFNREDGKEMFSIPYEALIVIYPDSKESVPQSGKVISHLPLPGAGLASLMNKSTKYANMTFDDPDIEVKGTASFRFDNKDNLLKFIDKLGAKAKMKQRGDAYYRPKASPVF
jgi:hypothetical protein